jgi:hypothetical protein
LNLDTFLEIGNQHKVCEDYIVSGNTPVPYIILSDGCSTANNSEMGARILCHLAKQYLKYNKDEIHDLDYWKLGQWVIHNAEQTARQLGLSISCLTATLIVAYYVDDYIRIMIYGDGSFITINAQDNIDIISIEFSGNAPYYLVYLIDSFRHDLYDKAKNTKKVIYHYADGSETEDESAYDHPMDFKIRTVNVPTVLVASDGIDTFLRKSGAVTQHLKAHEIINPCVAFKNIKGEFLKRRLNKQMKVFEQEGIGHFDDLSLGAFLNIEV